MADDLLQEAYYRFLRADAAYESEAHRRNVLFKIATNLARDARRRTRVLPFFVHDGEREVAAREDMAGQVERTTDVTQGDERAQAARSRHALAGVRGRLIPSGNRHGHGREDGQREAAAVPGPPAARHILGRTPAGGGA